MDYEDMTKKMKEEKIEFFQNREGIIKKTVIVAKPTLRKNSIGDEVRILQNNLKVTVNNKLKVDGDFGSCTESAVKAFQLVHMGKKEVDGIYGPKTAAKMNEVLNK